MCAEYNNYFEKPTKCPMAHNEINPYQQPLPTHLSASPPDKAVVEPKNGADAPPVEFLVIAGTCIISYKPIAWSWCKVRYSGITAVSKLAKQHPFRESL